MAPFPDPWTPIMFCHGAITSAVKKQTKVVTPEEMVDTAQFINSLNVELNCLVWLELSTIHVFLTNRPRFQREISPPPIAIDLYVCIYI